MRIQVKHNKVTISVNVTSTPFCCGGIQLGDFGTNIGESEVSEEVKEILYRKLTTRFLKEAKSSYRSKGLVLAIDVPDSGCNNFDGAYANSSYKRSGNMSLGDWCKFNGFTQSPRAFNRNTGNLVATYTLALLTSRETYTKKLKGSLPIMASTTTNSVLNKMREVLV